MGSHRKMSAAAARRLREQRLAEAAAPARLPDDFEQVLTAFAPHSLTDDEWRLVRPLVLEVMRRSKIRGKATFPQHLSDVTLYFTWAHRQDIPLELPALLDHARIEQWVRHGMADLDDTTKNTRRSRLRSLASHLNPGPTAPPRGKPIRRQAIKPPYSTREVAAIERLAETQPTARLKRQLSIIVGLGLGAGLDSSDLRHVRAEHVEDRGDAGIWVNVLGDRPRHVVVRRRYETFVRNGIAGLAPRSLVLGKDADRKNITAHIVACAVTLGDAPHIEQARLRATWLTHLMCAPVPLSVLMTAGGLTSARTLTDLLPFAAERAGIAVLRDGEP